MIQANPHVRTLFFSVVAALAWQFGVFLTERLLPLTTLTRPDGPAGADAGIWTVAGIAGTLLFAYSLSLLAEGLPGGPLGNFVRLFLLLWVGTTLNVVLELRIFSRMLENGGTAYQLAGGLLPCVLMASVLAVHGLAGQERAPLKTSRPEPLVGQPPAYWIARFPLGVLAFIAIYLLVGMIISPIVVPFYESDDTFILPAMGTLLAIATLRGSLYLGTLLLLIARWNGSRRELVLTLGLAFAMVSGCFALIIAPGVFPATIQVTHTIEIAVDAFLFIAATCLIFRKGIATRGHRSQEDALRTAGTRNHGTLSKTGEARA